MEGDTSHPSKPRDTGNENSLWQKARDDEFLRLLDQAALYAKLAKGNHLTLAEKRLRLNAAKTLRAEALTIR